jgi:DNA-binding SARP family transcriptional activator
MQETMGHPANTALIPDTTALPWNGYVAGATIDGMELLLLGSFELRDEGRIVPLQRQKHRALVARLALRPGEVVSGDALVEELWGSDPPRTARQALQNFVSLLRKQLGSDVIGTHKSGYALHVGAEQVDVTRFQRLAAEAGEARSAAERAALLRAALAIWRGPALVDLLYEPFAAVEARRLEELRLAAREDLIDAELELGNHADLIADLDSLVAENRFRERLRGQLMLALYRAGRQTDALRAYREARGALAELGLDPGLQLRTLERAILNQDPALELQAVLPDVEERRKTVTVLLCDLVPDVSEFDPEPARRQTVRALVEARAAIEFHGGSVETRAGDELLGVFGVPAAHEDDALRAARAAGQIRTLQPTLRIGIDTGEVLIGHGFVSGEVVVRSKRLERDADPGEVLLGAATVALCGDAVAVEPVDGSFRLLEVVEGAPPRARALDVPLVGRERELTALRRAFEASCRSSCVRLVTIVGEPGIGKTRLARELVTSIGEEATVLIGRCVSYGEGATWLPLAEALEQAGERLDSILEMAASPGEVFLETRRVFERLAGVRPLVLVFDDLHWAEPTLLDLIEYLAAQAGGPILCLCLARPELVATRPALAADAIRLRPLTERQAETLVAAVEPELRTRLVAVAGGNPLFLEQLVAFSREGGAIEALPPALEALLEARLDLLEAEERALLQYAAVVGRSFQRTALAELGAPVERLAGLEGKGLVRRLARGGYRFHHVLVREVAYASLPKAERAELHEQLADWLDGQGEPGELVGYHLEQAYQLGTELRRLDRRLRRLGADAGEQLGTAGVEAWKRGDTPAAVRLLGRASELLPERDPFRLALLCQLGPALRTGGALARAEETLTGAVETARTTGDRRHELQAQLELAYVRLFSDPEGRADEVLALAADAIPLFEALADDHSLGRAWRLVADVEGAMHCHYAAAADAAERALACYRSCGWPTSSCVGDLAAFLYYGPTHVSRAIDRCRQLLVGADRSGEARVLTFLAGLEAMQSRFDDARRLVANARKLHEDLGQLAAAEANCGTVAGRIEMLAGDYVAAEAILRATCAAFERTGNRAYLATRAAELADVLWLQGRDDEAEKWVGRSAELGASDDIPTQLAWRCVQGKLLARRGDGDKAEGLVREAIELSEQTDALDEQANARVDLAHVLTIDGRPAEAVEAAESAVDLFDRKGNRAAARRARGLLAELAVA